MIVLGCWSCAHSKDREITILAPIRCPDWIEGRKEDNSVKLSNFNFLGFRNKFWILGLVTGLNSNRSGPNLLESVDSELIFDWLDAYCAKNPSAELFDGAKEFLNEVSRQRRQ